MRRVPARDCPPKAFRRGLELGAGDAFQSSLLAHYVDFLVVTDFSDQILEHEDTPQRVHRVFDAEQVDEAFAAGEFDLVFSSNMMEHVPRPQRVLAGVQRVLSDDGIAIHVMPSPFLKACHMLGFHVDAVLTRLERCSNRRLPKLEDTGPFLWTATITSCWRNGVTDVYAGSFGRFHMEFHEATGKSSSCFAASRGKRCSRAQDSSWFRPFADRCLGLWLRTRQGEGVLERMGAPSEFVYVTSKKGHQTLYAPYFQRTNAQRLESIPSRAPRHVS